MTKAIPANVRADRLIADIRKLETQLRGRAMTPELMAVLIALVNCRTLLAEHVSFITVRGDRTRRLIG